MATSVAMVSATNGLPKKARIEATSVGMGIYEDSVPSRIRHSGVSTMARTMPKEGSSLSSLAPSAEVKCSGTSVKMRPPTLRPQTTPATAMAIKAVGMPTRIMVPRSTPSVPATRTEPAEGGTKA